MENHIVCDLPPGPNNPRNSEGSFITLADGRLLYAYSRYSGSEGSDHAPAVIALRESTDGGRTWSDEDTGVLIDREGECNVMSTSFLRLQDGRIAFMYLRKNSFHDCRPLLRFSDDEGESWSEPVLAIRSPGYWVVNNDRLIQLRGGRLVIPSAFHRSMNPDPMDTTSPFMDGRAIAIFHLSDDGGATWREAKDWVSLPVRSTSGLQEPGVVELANGSLYAYARTSTGKHWQTRSHDRGEHWSPPQPSRFRAPCSPLSIKRLANGDLVAVWNDHSRRWKEQLPDRPEGTSWGRTPLAIAISRDEGKRWRFAKLLEDDPERGFCYITLHPLEDALLLAYCCGGDGHSVLARTCIRRVDHEWLYSSDGA